MKDFDAEYNRLIDTLDFHEEKLDYNLLDKHIRILSELTHVSNSGITVFDMYKRKHVFASYNFAELFNYDLSRIEKEDSDYFKL